jgi:uncharacterized membrane protein YdbT with pleckstrin-like domain
MAGYVEKTLARGERIIHRASYNWTYSFFPVLWFAIGCAPIVIYFLLQYSRDLDFEQLRVGWYAAWTGFSVGSLILTAHLIELWTTEFAVTTYRFVFKKGWIKRDTQEVSLNKIEEIVLQQSFWGRIFGYGKVTLRGTGVGLIELPNLDNPILVRRIIENAKADLRRDNRDERLGDDD